ncbi:MAG: hypothetical protein FWE19_01980 [Oscillospiraceae bacterium]|nr:hypothetical protein [Oscillospiraceae bacterium]
MKIRLAAVFAALMLLGACSGQPATPTPAQPPAVLPPVWESRQPSEVVIAVSRDAGSVLVNAAQDFAGQLETRTGGQLTARVQLSASPDADLRAGRAQIALLNERQQLEFCRPLAATATPFLYHGVQNFLMRANAETTISILEFSLRENHGVVPLVAFFQGAEHLLIDFSPGGYHHFLGAEILTSSYQGAQEPFTRLAGQDGKVNHYDTDRQRLESFLMGQANAAQISAEVLAGEYLSFVEPAHLIVSYHDLTPAWLLASAGFIDGLPPRWRAELFELQAHMASQINSAHQDSEEKILRELEGWANVSVVFEFSHVRNRVLNTMPELSPDADPQQRLARDLVEIMRRTA